MVADKRLIFQSLEAAQEAALDMNPPHAVAKVTLGWEVSQVTVCRPYMPAWPPKPVPGYKPLDPKAITGDDAVHFDLPVIGLSKRQAQLRLTDDNWLKIQFDSMTAFEIYQAETLRIRFVVPRRWASRASLLRHAVKG